MAVWDVTPRIQPLVARADHQRLASTRRSISSNWTFTALAGEQVKFHLINETSTGLLYSLTGPNGFSGFSNLTGDSPLINLPSSGSVYVVGARRATGRRATTRSSSNPTTLTSRAAQRLDQRHAGRLSGRRSCSAIAVPAVQSLIVSLRRPCEQRLATNSICDSARRRLARRTIIVIQPPTAANQSNHRSQCRDRHVVRARLRKQRARVSSTFNLSADGVQLQLNEVLPKAIGNAGPMTLELTGDGFEPGTTVTLVGPGNTQNSATSVNVVSFTQLVATFPQGLPAGVYSVVVNQGTSSNTLPVR